MVFQYGYFVSSTIFDLIVSGNKTTYETFIDQRELDRLFVIMGEDYIPSGKCCYVEFSQEVVYENADTYFRSINASEKLIEDIGYNLIPAMRSHYSSDIKSFPEYFNRKVYVYQLTVFDKEIIEQRYGQYYGITPSRYDSSGNKELEKKMVKKFLNQTLLERVELLTYLAKGLEIDFDIINFIRSCWMHMIIKELNNYTHYIRIYLKPTNKELELILIVRRLLGVAHEDELKNFIKIQISEDEIREFLALGHF